MAANRKASLASGFEEENDENDSVDLSDFELEEVEEIEEEEEDREREDPEVLGAEPYRFEPYRVSDFMSCMLSLSVSAWPGQAGALCESVCVGFWLTPTVFMLHNFVKTRQIQKNN